MGSPTRSPSTVTGRAWRMVPSVTTLASKLVPPMSMQIALR